MLIYLFPFLADFVNFLVLLRVCDAAGREMRLSDAQAASLVAIFSICYLLMCLAAGRLLGRRNAKPILVASTVMMMLSGVPLLFTTTYWPTLALISVFGGTLAFFFNSFQTFMRGEVPPGTLGVTISRYTLAWSLGIALGCLAGGALKAWTGSWGLAAISGGFCLLILAMVLKHRPRPLTQASTDGRVEQPAASRPVDARYVLVGLSVVFMINFTQRPITTFVPKFYAQAGNPEWMAGILMFALFLGQSLAGFAAGRIRGLLYRRSVMLAAQFVLVAALGMLYWVGSLSFVPVLALMLLLGSVYGTLLFASFYYSSNDPRSSRNIGLTESMVGTGNVVGLAVCQLAMARGGDNQAFLTTSIGLALVVMAVQLAYLRMARPRLHEPAKSPAPKPQSLADA